MSDLIYPTINLVILIAVMVVYLREPLRNFVNQRHVSIRDELQRVRELLARAKAQYEAFNSKLKAMDAEIASLREQAKQDADASKSRIQAEAQRLSATIISDARISAEGLYSRLKGELFSEIGLRVLDRVEVVLREGLTGDDRVRIRREFSTQLETVQ